MNGEKKQKTPAGNERTSLSVRLYNCREALTGGAATTHNGSGVDRLPEIECGQRLAKRADRRFARIDGHNGLPWAIGALDKVYPA